MNFLLFPLRPLQSFIFLSIGLFNTSRYIMMKGGSYFKPSSSWWYVQGGPRELHYQQHLLRYRKALSARPPLGLDVQWIEIGLDKPKK